MHFVIFLTIAIEEVFVHDNLTPSAKQLISCGIVVKCANVFIFSEKMSTLFVKNMRVIKRTKG